MTEDVKIQSPIEIKSSSKEQTAFDLMKFISNREDLSGNESKDRKYWLTLYYQCMKATSERSLESILKEE